MERTAMWLKCQVNGWPALALQGPPEIPDGACTISFTGDFGFWNRHPDIAAISDNIEREREFLAGFDLRVLNLEFNLPGQGGRPSDFECERASLEIITRLGFDVISLANNHAASHGDIGISRNVNLLEERNIAIIGLRDRPSFMQEIAGFRLGLFSVTHLLDDPDREGRVLRTEPHHLSLIRESLAGSDVVIGFPHLGSRSIYPTPHERKLARQLLGIGANLLVCTGSHFVKGMLLTDSRPVVYGLGNHWFTWSGGGTEPIGMHLVVAVTESGQIAGLYAVPFHNDIMNGMSGPLDDKEADAFFHEYMARSVDDPSLVWSDPRMQKGVLDRLQNLSWAQLRRLRPRHLSYGLRVLYHRLTGR